MNIRNVIQYFVFVFVVGVAFFAPFVDHASASTNAVMSQAILPVRFVYLEKNGNINRVWSNVTEKDQAYVVKFFDEKKIELPSDKKMILKFVEKNEENAISRQRTQATQFVEKNGAIEEIKTIV